MSSSYLTAFVQQHVVGFGRYRQGAVLLSEACFEADVLFMPPAAANYFRDAASSCITASWASWNTPTNAAS